MTTVKEVKLMKDGAMVTPVVLVDSIKNLDGTKYKDKIQELLDNLEDMISDLATNIMPLNWKEFSVEGMTPYYVDYANGTFFLGWSGQYQTGNNSAFSNDGINWTVVPNTTIFGSGYSYAGFCMTYGNGKFVVGGKNKVAYSTDLLNWTTGDVNFTFSNIAYGNGIFVAIGSNSLRYSTDGINWTLKSMGKSTRCVAYGNGKFVVGGVDGAVWYSTDGINWTMGSQDAITNSIASIAYGNGRFVMGNDYYNGKIAYSNDGINWNAGVSWVTDITITDIAYGNGKFIAGGRKVSGSSPNSLAYSSDGINWTAINQNLFGYVLGVAYGNGKFVVGGNEKFARCTC